MNRVLDTLDAGLEAAVELPTWSMSPAEQREALVAFARVESRIAALRLGVVAQRDDVGSQTGATSTAAWHADATGQTPAQRHRLARQASKLDHHDPVREAPAAGEVRLDQAEVIADAVDALPADLVEESVREESGAALLAYATGEHTLTAPELRRVGKRILEAVAPDVADEVLRRQLEAEEARAAAKTRFTISDDGYGLTHGRFTLMTPENLLGARRPRPWTPAT